VNRADKPIRYDEDRVPPYDPAEQVHFWVLGVLHRATPDMVSATRAGDDEPIEIHDGTVVRVSGIHCFYCAGYPDAHENLPCSGERP
jgi:hypothetical protein